MDGLRCIDDFTLRCLDREHRAYFNTLYAGTTQVIVDLCQEGPYQSGTFTHCYKFFPKHEPAATIWAFKNTLKPRYNEEDHHTHFVHYIQ